MIEGFIHKQDVVDMLLDIKNAAGEEAYDPFVICNNINAAINEKLKELSE